jgi:membrane protein DedA with SNARE-associated domain
VLAALISVPANLGYAAVFAFVAIETMGIPVPGETALVAAALLAHHGQMDIVVLVLVAAAAAIVGDNVGYWLGRAGGRRVLERWRLTRRFSERTLPPAERFFRRHGGKTVFFGRFFAGLRITAAWVAGISHMPWWRFFMWNAAGGIVWAVAIGLLAYYVGDAALHVVERVGVYGAIGIVAAVVVALVVVRVLKKRILPET